MGRHAARAMPDRAPTPLRLLHQMARSGGTLISRCLACMDGVALLSEVHAGATGFVNPLAQAQAWFAPFDAAAWAALARRGAIPFPDAIETIELALRRQGRRLVLREWSHLDFTGVPLVADPPLRSLTAEALESRFALIRFATVRHPLDQYLSACVVPALRGRLAVAPYFKGYRRFAEMAAEVGFVTYESFCADPVDTMRRLCGALKLPVDPTFLDRQAGWTRITGDHAIGGGRGGSVPRMLPRRVCPRATLDAIVSNPDYRRSLDILGYCDAEAELRPAGTDPSHARHTCRS
jgi:hypothetical protein